MDFFLQKNNKKFVFVLIIFLFACLLYSKQIYANSAHRSFTKTHIPNFEEEKDDFLRCIKKIATVYYNEIYRFSEELNTCLITYFPINYDEFDAFPNGASGERKVFLPMVPEFNNQECRWLKIGSRGIIAEEELFLSKHSNCKIYGIDSLGLKNFTNTETAKKDKSVKTLSLPLMIDEFVRFPLIHYLSADIESYEKLIQKLKKNEKLSKKEITFCQIDVELHNPKQGGQHPDAANINRVQWVLDFIAEPSPYLPFLVHPGTPQRITFANIVNAECEKAFKISSYLNK